MIRNDFIIRTEYRNLLFTVLFIFFAFFSNATNYYVSNSGNDSYPGTSERLPWKTISKVNASTFKEGDQILFKRGDTFYGSLTIRNSGTSGNLITYGAYGTGDKPIITGYTELTSWTDEGGNIYSTSLTPGFYLNNVAINDTIRDMGRYPNTGWLVIDSHDGSTSITDNNLTGSWTDAEAVIRKNKWIIDRSEITDGETTTLTIASYEAGDLVAPGNATYSSTDGNGYFIQKSLATLDTLGEWFHDETTDKLYVYSNDEPTNVKASTIQNLISMNSKSNITFDNLTFEGGNSLLLSIASTCSDIQFNDCTFQMGGYGMYGYATDVDFNNCNFSNMAAKGIGSYGNNVNVKGCSFENIGIHPGLMWSGAGGNALTMAGAGDTIQYNTFTNIGFNAIAFSKRNTVVKYNYIDRFCFIKDDGAGIYFGYGGTSDGSIISNNIVINGIGAVAGAEGNNSIPLAAGIYGDNETDNVDIYNNTVSETSRGIFLNGPTDSVDVQNNTLYNNELAFKVTTYSSPATNSVVFKNNIIAKSEDIIVTTNTAINTDVDYAAINLALYTSYYSTGIYDYNDYVFHSNDNSFLFQNRETGQGADFRNFEDWKTFTSTETNSTLTVDDSELFYNYNSTDSTITLSQPMIDVKGTKYSGSITLQPYTSVILMRY
ncbi:MAG: right-handed parallel beta-helix repeat-containing protein [Bacteroidota bacterium]